MIFQIIIWVLAIYGFIEIVMSLLNSYVLVNNNLDDMYIFIAVKNREESIESIVRTIVFKNIYYRNEELFSNIIIADMGSTDRTLDILRKLAREYEFLRILECKDNESYIDNILKNENSKFVNI
jgi:hypothetical protein